MTTNTWCPFPTAASALPTATAAAPPIPASTSSKMSVGGDCVNTSRNANMTLASSPPEATFDNGKGGLPGLAESKKFKPSPDGSCDSGAKSTWNTASGSASRRRCFCTALANCGAPSILFLRTTASAFRTRSFAAAIDASRSRARCS